MDENKINDAMDENEEAEVVMLTDEDGNEEQFELLCSCEFEGGVYYAFVPAYKEDCEEYVILKAIEEENGEVSLTSIDDSVEGHLCVYAAETSRKEKRTIDLADIR